MKRIILTVCKGNIHRSVIAAICIEKLLREQELQEMIGVRSRGLQGSFGTTPPRAPSLREYPVEWELTRPGLEAFGLEIPLIQPSTPITKGDVESATLVLAMDESVLQTLLSNFEEEVPELRSKMILFAELGGKSAGVPDLAGKNDPDMFNEVTTMIYSTAKENLDELLRLVNRL